MRIISNDLRASREGASLKFQITSAQFLDEARIEKVHAQIHALAAMEDKADVEISFQGVEAVSSMALRALIDLRTSVRKNGGTVALSGLNDNLKKLLSAVKLDGMFALR